MLGEVTAILNQAGAILLDCFERRVPAQEKGFLDIVTEADLRASHLISQQLEAAFPGIEVHCEEHPRAGSASRYWILDPLDGTKNFCHGHPYFCTSLALVEASQPVLAATFDPVRNELFTALRGKGAALNGKPIQVSSASELRQAMVASGFPSGKRHQALDPGPFLRMASACRALRRTGSTALDLAYVASGRFDAFWDWGLEDWDVAAGWLLVQEAGGWAGGWDGRAYTLGRQDVVLSNQRLPGEVAGLLTDSRSIFPCGGELLSPGENTPR